MLNFIITLNLVKSSRLSIKLFNRHFYKRNKDFKMNTAYIKYLQEKDQSIQIKFRYVDEVRSVDKIFTFERSLCEQVSSFINRAQSNVEKEFVKKTKKKKQKKDDNIQVSDWVTPKVQIQLLKNSVCMANSTFADLLQSFEDSCSNFTLIVMDTSYNICYNFPSVNSIMLPASVLAGFFVYPTKLDLQCANKKDSEFIWYRGQLPKSKKEEEIEWLQVYSGFSYLARSEDVSFRLKVKCTPKSGSKEGPAIEAFSKNEVEAGPGICPFETRHLFTKNRLSNQEFRVVSYNLLADYYADSDYSRTVLFGHCPEYALHIDYRKQLLMKEITGYNSDLYMMQEVDSKIFDLDLEPLLNEHGLAGIYQKKGTTAEGLATFYNTKRFELVEKFGLVIGSNIKVLPEFQELWSKIKTNEKLVDRIVDRSTTLQVVILRSKDVANKFVVIANTHLFFHPDADHIRLLQIGFSVIYVQNLIENFKKERNLKDENIGLIFAGDFNSVPECGIYKLFTQKLVDDTFVDWKSNKEEAVTNVQLTQPYNMQSACGTPKYTNYVPGFKACLDYIFYQTEHFQVQEIIPMPSDEELSAHVAIPSVVFPSDHVAIVANLKYI